MTKPDITDNWVTVPTNSVLTIHKQTVLIHPIKDEFYSRDPAHSRNADFAIDKGLVSPDRETLQVPLSIGSGQSLEVDVMRRKLEEVQIQKARDKNLTQV